MDICDFDLSPSPSLTAVHKKYPICFVHYKNLRGEHTYIWYMSSGRKNKEIKEIRDNSPEDISEDYLSLLLLKYSML